jgi:hypothetical protein
LGSIWHNNRSQRFRSRFNSVVLDTNPLANVYLMGRQIQILEIEINAQSS